MYQKEFTELGKAAYLACCPSIRLVRVLPPKDSTKKATFLIEAPFQKFLDLLEDKWDNPQKSGKPGIPDARKYFFKTRQLRDKAIAVCKTT